MATAPTSSPAGKSSARLADNLALGFQEVLTAIVRMRANSQNITDAETFRAQVRAALKQADQECTQQRGYLAEDVKLATFAVVAFLDESILNSRNPVFVDWPRKPLQEELFGVHVAGEIFFRNVERLLTRPDSNELADVLEVHLLCILLGFAGATAWAAAGTAQFHRADSREDPAHSRLQSGAVAVLGAAGGGSSPRGGSVGEAAAGDLDLHGGPGNRAVRGVQDLPDVGGVRGGNAGGSGAVMRRNAG